MVALLILFVILAIFLVVTRIAAVALSETGLSGDAARFQALSAFTGTGFTTREAEGVMSHPVRRRIVTFLMVLGNAGLVTIITILVLSFAQSPDPGAALRRAAVLVAGLGGLLLLARSDWMDRQLTWLIDLALERFTELGVTDYYSLLNLQESYVVSRVGVAGESRLAGRTLEEARLPEEGLLVLGIERADGSFIGAPRGEERVEAGDSLLLYGREDRMEEVVKRLPDDDSESPVERFAPVSGE